MIQSSQFDPATMAGHHFGAVRRNPAVAQLQQALTALATATRDRSIALKADGIAGPATMRAVNRAFTVHIGPGQAPATFRTGALPLTTIVNQAAALANYVAAEARRRGAAAPGTPSSQYLQEMAKQIKARVPSAQVQYTPSMKPIPTATATVPVKTPGPAYPPTVLGLQNALGYLAREVGDQSVATTADGKLGPRTVAAVNGALVKYVRAAAAASLRTGRLTLAQVRGMVPRLVGFIAGEAASRHFGTNPPAMTPGAPMAPGTGPAAAGPGSSRPKQPKMPPGPRIKPGRSAALALLQTRLGQLGRVTGDTSLVIKVDGITGPKTAAAVNKAMQTHVSTAPPSFKTGRLTPLVVKAQAATLAQLVADEVAKRGATPASAPPEGSDAVASDDAGGGSEPHYEPIPEPSARGDDEGGGGGVGPAPAYTPSAAAYTPPAAYLPPPPPPGGGGGGDLVPGGGDVPGGGLAPPGGEPGGGGDGGGGEPSKFPLVPVLIGVGVAAVLVTVVVVATSKKKPGESEGRRSPAYFPQTAAA